MGQLTQQNEYTLDQVSVDNGVLGILNHKVHSSFPALV